jgi:hypothetical protein
MIEVFSSGGGTQSSAIAALIIQGKMPKPDFAVIADTGRERSSTWQYLEDIVNPSLQSIGLEIVRVKYSEYGSIPDHGKQWLSHNKETVLMPGFTNQVTGSVGKLSAFCSKSWKQHVVDRWLSKVKGITRSQYRKWIGFSLNECKRALSMMDGEEYTKGLIRFPLIHDIPMRRHQAILECQKIGWPTPPRSACYDCPNQKDDEWLGITQEELHMAALLEKEIQQRDPFFWLHRSCIPIDQVNFSQEPDLFERACDSGNCFV